MKRVILTGATGFIGRQTIALLLELDYEIIAFTSKADSRLASAVELVQVDLADSKAVQKAVKAARASHLLHLAWQPVISGLWGARENLDWVHISLNLAQSFMAAGGERMCFAGSCGEYDWRAGLCVEDITPLAPETHYGACKHALETLITSLARQQKVSCSWGRAFFIYGPNEHPDRLGASVALSLLKGETAKCSHGMQLRDYMHVADVAAGYVALLDSTNEGAYNIATGTAIRVKDLIMALATAAGCPELVRLGARPAPAYEPPLIVAEMSKTRAALDWQPRHSLESGAQDVIDWFRANI